MEPLLTQFPVKADSGAKCRGLYIYCGQQLIIEVRRERGSSNSTEVLHS